MTEINAENINNLITNDVKQFMKEVKTKKERSERQKENDAKLKDRLKLYHQQKKEAKLKEQEIAFKHIQDSFREIQEMKSSVIDDNIDDDIKPTVIDITDIVIDNEAVEVLKSKRGRPKKHQHPGPSEIIAASV